MALFKVKAHKKKKVAGKRVHLTHSATTLETDDLQQH